MKKYVNGHYFDLTQQEIDAINALNKSDWSKPYPIRVTITHEIESDWAIKMQRHATFNAYPDISYIMEYVKSIPLDQVEHNGAIHIYLTELYDEHMDILEKHGAVVEIRSDF